MTTRSVLGITLLAAVVTVGCGGDDSPASPTTLTNSGGTSSGSSAGTQGQGGCTLPPAPTGLRVSSQNGTSVELTWNAVPGATSYTLLVGSKPGATDTLSESTTHNSFRFTAKDGKQYARVQANSPCGAGVTGGSIEFVVIP
jgi:hypothetical protein